MFKERTEKFLAQVLADGAQGALVHKPSNMRWLSGYTGEGLLVIAEGVHAIVTDFRYTEQAGRQAPDYQVHMISTGVTHEKIAAEILQGASVRTVSFEDDFVTVKGMEALRGALSGIAFAPQGRQVEKLREIKDNGEIALLEKACDISCSAFEHILTVIRPGMTEIEVRFELENALYRYGAEDLAFHTIIAAGENGALPHAIPGHREIRVGDMVTMDFGARYGGYCADITRTVAVGALDDEKKKIYTTVLEAQLRALSAIRPGARCAEVDQIARDYISAAGYEGRFGHGLGHAVGLDIHETPAFSQRSEATLEAGIVITDEPGIYMPGECGCRIEDTVLVTPDGYRRLTTASKELIIL